VTVRTIDDPSVDMVIEGSVARVTFSNPGKRNAFTWRMYDQLLHIAENLGDGGLVSAVVFQGHAGDGFAAGTDIRQFVDFDSGAAGVDYERRVARVWEAIAAIPVPTIAAVDGAAVGAGLAVAAMCDIVVAERGARFGAPIARTLGNCLPVAVVARLRSVLGARRTTSMLLASALVPAEDLVGCGFVAALAEPGEVQVAVDALLKRVQTSAPLTLRALKEMNRRLDRSSPLPDDYDLLELCYGSSDFHEGIRAFLEHRHPDWSGH